jgi:hypothetical protein
MWQTGIQRQGAGGAHAHTTKQTECRRRRMTPRVLRERRVLRQTRREIGDTAFHRVENACAYAELCLP